MWTWLRRLLGRPEPPPTLIDRICESLRTEPQQWRLVEQYFAATTYLVHSRSSVAVKPDGDLVFVGACLLSTHRLGGGGGRDRLAAAVVEWLTPYLTKRKGAPDGDDH